MDLVSVIVESMDLDPLKLYENSDPYELFSEDGNAFLEEALEEAGKEANKKTFCKGFGTLSKRSANGFPSSYLNFSLLLKDYLRRNLKVQIRLRKK